MSGEEEPGPPASSATPDAVRAAKTAARRAAFARRAAAHAEAPDDACAPLIEALAAHRGRPLSGYMPIRTEIDPRPAMALAARHGSVGVPVIRAKGAPLDFHLWTPDTPMVPGPFGAMVPREPRPMTPEVLIVPLAAFTRAGFRLGYGGGFYDRTLAALRARGPVLAIGFAYAAQETETLPLEPFDAPLDLVVTETEVILPSPS
ncbi:5-formyltetrahydrofolate cyclo-ligase [Histidinibacterium lentulum]|uniref:5-formyltetrahydrofolate cyclo-ligase n=1 Tax=Histidinibacterium lentulum TaxID=2480588 RepID=A0A3N2QYB4_9RHOB|nr:5-formyltetrahydrofolate cyclo-ligase [Histidinibacterium lentulum]ROU00190.1 5-formyltetrahydrofolate cyclo-ligase [Histidinibacterium lentulum]